MLLLDNIRVLTRAVELGRFLAAGRNMRLSARVVSHRIGTLERHLGCGFSTRTTRKMNSRTVSSTRIASTCLLRLIVRRRAWRTRAAKPRGTLKITAPSAFGCCVVAPMLPRFQARYPELALPGVVDDLVDLFTELVDVAVRMAILPDSSLIVRKIADVKRVLCAAPSYTERHGAPWTIGDLMQHRCLLLPSWVGVSSDGR